MMCGWAKYTTSVYPHRYFNEINNWLELHKIPLWAYMPWKNMSWMHWDSSLVMMFSCFRSCNTVSLRQELNMVGLWLHIFVLVTFLCMPTLSAARLSLSCSLEGYTTHRITPHGLLYFHLFYWETVLLQWSSHCARLRKHELTNAS